MTLEDFAEMTRLVIARDGFEAYLPTACYPKRRHIAVLEGLPPGGTDVESKCLEWAGSKQQDEEEFLVAFKIDDSHFKVVRHASGALEEAIFFVEVA